MQRLPVDVGQFVPANQLIAELDSRDYELQVQEAQASLTRALASKRNADAERDRVRELCENDNVSLSQWDQARSVAESAAAQVESLEKRLELAQRQLLRAPPLEVGGGPRERRPRETSRKRCARCNG